MARKTRLGLLGPAVVIVGLIVGGIGAWMIYKNKPEAGGVIDTLVVDATTKIVIRAEAGGPRAFVELQENGDVTWQAMVPPYAGGPGRVGVTWSNVAVSVRVTRGGKAELFSLARANGSKLGGIHLAGNHDKIKVDAKGPLSFTDHARSYELVEGDGWNQINGVDLKLGTILWTKELGATPITGGVVEGAYLVLEQAGTKYGKRWFNVFTGKEDRSVEKQGKPWEEKPQIAPEWPAQTGSNMK
jgi:hypothetical protein